MRRGLGILLLAAFVACTTSSAYDPVVTDPLGDDPEHPLALVGTPIESDGARMNGITYLAGGAGPHPTLILLHGYPGEERNLDLAQAIRRAGWNVLFFHYRGAWGSQGSFSFSNAIADVGAAVALARSPEFASSHRADPDRIALLGHSMGGFLALIAGSELEAVDCIGSISGANLALRAGLDAEAAARAAQRLDAWSDPIRGTSGSALVAEIARNGERFDVTRRATALADRKILLVAGARDEVTPLESNHAPLAAALEAAGARSLRTRVLDADHAYSTRRIALAHTVVAWLTEACSE